MNFLFKFENSWGGLSLNIGYEGYMCFILGVYGSNLVGGL